MPIAQDLLGVQNSDADKSTDHTQLSNFMTVSIPEKRLFSAVVGSVKIVQPSPCGHSLGDGNTSNWPLWWKKCTGFVCQHDCKEMQHQSCSYESRLGPAAQTELEKAVTARLAMDAAKYGQSVPGKINSVPGASATLK